MSSDPIHDVPVGLQPVLQDLSETPRVDPLKRLIEALPAQAAAAQNEGQDRREGVDFAAPGRDAALAPGPASGSEF